MKIVFPRDEEWMELIVDSRYLVSTMGRLYDLRRCRLVRLVYLGQADVWVWHVRDARSSQVSRSLAVHAGRAVLSAFEGPGRGPVHADGDRRNVALANLSWASPGGVSRVLRSVG